MEQGASLKLKVDSLKQDFIGLLGDLDKFKNQPPRNVAKFDDSVVRRCKLLALGGPSKNSNGGAHMEGYESDDKENFPVHKKLRQVNSRQPLKDTRQVPSLNSSRETGHSSNRPRCSSPIRSDRMDDKQQITRFYSSSEERCDEKLNVSCIGPMTNELHEQISGANLTGAFCSTFHYPLHSTVLESCERPTSISSIHSSNRLVSATVKDPRRLRRQNAQTKLNYVKFRLPDDPFAEERARIMKNLSITAVRQSDPDLTNLSLSTSSDDSESTIFAEEELGDLPSPSNCTLVSVDVDMPAPSGLDTSPEGEGKSRPIVPTNSPNFSEGPSMESYYSSSVSSHAELADSIFSPLKKRRFCRKRSSAASGSKTAEEKMSMSKILGWAPSDVAAVADNVSSHLLPEYRTLASSRQASDTFVINKQTPWKTVTFADHVRGLPQPEYHTLDGNLKASDTFVIDKEALLKTPTSADHAINHPLPEYLALDSTRKASDTFVIKNQSSLKTPCDTTTSADHVSSHLQPEHRAVDNPFRGSDTFVFNAHELMITRGATADNVSKHLHPGYRAPDGPRRNFQLIVPTNSPNFSEGPSMESYYSSSVSSHAELADAIFSPLKKKKYRLREKGLNAATRSKTAKEKLSISKILAWTPSNEATAADLANSCSQPEHRAKDSPRKVSDTIVFNAPELMVTSFGATAAAGNTSSCLQSKRQAVDGPPIASDTFVFGAQESMIASFDKTSEANNNFQPEYCAFDQPHGASNISQRSDLASTISEPCDQPNRSQKSIRESCLQTHRKRTVAKRLKSFRKTLLEGCNGDVQLKAFGQL